MKKILSGNEAIARGFYEAGGKIAAAYPGTPSTEVLEALAGYRGLHAEWSVNEKAAFEVALGGSIAGARAMACMKHVGVNVAADPLMTASYTGVNAGLVLMAADDPGMFSSQNEQDSRQYARFAKIPCVEPSDSQEALEFTKAALSLSEEFDTPVMLRTTTRTSHGRGVVELSTPERRRAKRPARDFTKYGMLPTYARARHEFAEERLRRLAAWAETASLNRVHEGGSGLGIIAGGISYQYAREAFPDASVLKLGLMYPLPEKLVRKFAAGVRRLAVVEELDPFIEGEVRALGVKVHFGKGAMPSCGEYGVELVREAITGVKPRAGKPAMKPVGGLVKRQPALCPGCSHRGLFTALSRLDAYVFGDIGCYTLGGLPPFSAMHSVVCMGASITGAHGVSKGLMGRKGASKPVAVIGDSTFLHSGMTGLLDLVYNGGEAVVVIMNNRTTGMTGGQDHPGTGLTLRGGGAPMVDIMGICRALGAGRVREIDAYDLKGLEKALKEEMRAAGVSVLVSNQPCALYYNVSKKPSAVDAKRCDGCGECLGAGCIALGLAGTPGRAEVDPLLCRGCGICAQLCRRRAITAGGPWA